MNLHVKLSTPGKALAANHLSIRPEGSGPAEVHFLFERREKRMGGALGSSIMAHGGIVLVYFLIAWLAPQDVREAMIPIQLTDLVWVPQPGPGGGGGGSPKPEAPPKVELKVPEVRKPTPEPTPEKPPEEINIPVKTIDANTLVVPGLAVAQNASAGAGIGDGAAGGRGSGLGPGFGGGTGGGAFRPGNGVELPQPLREVKPQYTAEAMRAKVQGTVLLECVVLPDGSVGNVEVVKSLDPTFGLDSEAIKAAKQWRFRPGTRFGEPVAVLVTIELTFTLR